jgi:hypothetical protein
MGKKAHSKGTRDNVCPDAALLASAAANEIRSERRGYEARITA